METIAPWANTTAQWFGGTFNTSMPRHEKIVLHTTEGNGWPAYNGGASAPHLTWRYDGPGKRTVRQHFRFDQMSRALRNLAGGVQTNADGCIQVELVGTCAKGGPGLFWPGAPEDALRLLATDLVWLCDELDIPRTFAPTWLPYPASYGATNARMSGAIFDAFRGILGHQHVPENTHGDPGDLDVATLARLMEDDMELSDPIGRAKIETGAALTVGIAMERGYNWDRDTNTRVARIETAVDQLLTRGPAPSAGAPTAVVLSDAQMDAIADRVIAKLGTKLKTS